MTNDRMLGGLYLLMAIMIVLGGLITRRERGAKLLVMAMDWIAIFGAGFILSGSGWAMARPRFLIQQHFT